METINDSERDRRVEYHFFLPFKPCFQSVVHIVASMRYFQKSSFSLCCISEQSYTDNQKKLIEQVFQQFYCQYGDHTQTCDVFFISKGDFEKVYRPNRVPPFANEHKVDWSDAYIEQFFTLSMMISYSEFKTNASSSSSYKKINQLLWDSEVFPLKQESLFLEQYCNVQQCYKELMMCEKYPNVLAFLFDDIRYNKQKGSFYNDCVKDLHTVLSSVKFWDSACTWLEEDKISKMEARAKKMILEKNQNNNAPIIYSNKI